MLCCDPGMHQAEEALGLCVKTDSLDHGQG